MYYKGRSKWENYEGFILYRISTSKDDSTWYENHKTERGRVSGVGTWCGLVNGLGQVSLGRYQKVFRQGRTGRRVRGPGRRVCRRWVLGDIG